MIDTYLVPPGTTVTAKGDGAPADLAAALQRVFLLILRITRIIEQESLDVAVHGSPDGAKWGDKPLLSFPQTFYAGEQPLLLDLTASPDVKFLRAHWEVARWGRGDEKPSFEFQVSLQEVAPEILKEASGLRPRS